MKKKILTLAILAISAISFTVSAQQATSTECSKKDCPKKECQGGKSGKEARGQQMGLGTMTAFEGIDLTEAQRTSIEAINNDFMATRQAMKKDNKGQKDKAGKCAMKDGKKKGDKKKCNKADCPKMKNAGDKEQKMAARKESRLAYLRQVQKVLTPEQYVTFLENNVVNISGTFKAPVEKMGRPYGTGMRRGDGKAKGNCEKGNATCAKAATTASK